MTSISFASRVASLALAIAGALVLCGNTARADQPPASPQPSPQQPSPQPAPVQPSPAPNPPAPAVSPPAPEASPPSPEPPPSAMLFIPRGSSARRTTWDLNVEMGAGFVWSDAQLTNLFARIRGGVLFIRERAFTMAGLTYEYSSYSPATFGGQVEVLLRRSGVWGQGGIFMDVQGHAGGAIAGGFSVLGLELQYRAYEGHPTAPALYLKLRIPIGAIASAFAQKP